MIAALTGRVMRTSPGGAVIDVGGVGYKVSLPLSSWSLVATIGAEVLLRIVTVVREDEISLYGFATEEEETLFTLLQNVTGVGPKLALKILSGIDPERLRAGIGSGDTALLTSISGVGKKMSERMVVELRDKVGELPDTGGSSPLVGAHAAVEAVDALTNLGYPQKIAQRAVDSLAADADAGVEDIIKMALKALAPKR